MKLLIKSIIYLVRLAQAEQETGNPKLWYLTEKDPQTKLFISLKMFLNFLRTDREIFENRLLDEEKRMHN